MWGLVPFLVEKGNQEATRFSAILAGLNKTHTHTQTDTPGAAPHQGSVVRQPVVSGMGELEPLFCRGLMGSPYQSKPPDLEGIGHCFSAERTCVDVESVRLEMPMGLNAASEARRYALQLDHRFFLFFFPWGKPLVPATS